MCFPRSESVIVVSLGWRNQTRMFLQMKPPSLLLPLTKVVLRALFFPKIPACPAWGLFICLVYKPECPTFPDEPADCSLSWLRSQEQAGARLLTKLLRARNLHLCHLWSDFFKGSALQLGGHWIHAQVSKLSWKLFFLAVSFVCLFSFFFQFSLRKTGIQLIGCF